MHTIGVLQYGLYSSFMGCFVYALLGSSKDIAIGPVAIISLLVSSFALSPVPGDATYAIIVSLVGGSVQVIIGLLNIGESAQCRLLPSTFRQEFCSQWTSRVEQFTSVASLPALRPWAPPAERGPSPESIYRVSRSKISSLKNYFTTASCGPLKQKKIRGALGTALVYL